MSRKMLIDGEVSQPNQGEVHYDFDLFVIGAGSGGVRASRFSANFGAKVRIYTLPENTSINFVHPFPFMTEAYYGFISFDFIGWDM